MDFWVIALASFVGCVGAVVFLTGVALVAFTTPSKDGVREIKIESGL